MLLDKFVISVLRTVEHYLVAYVYRYFFFFQAEDGIRDLIVTGVQTCALPILRGRKSRGCVKSCAPYARTLMIRRFVWREWRARSKPKIHAAPLISVQPIFVQIGRAHV